MAMIADLKVRNLTKDEVSLIVDWAAEEGWNPGINDADAFYAADPDGFFGAFDDQGLAGCYSLVQYEGDAAFGGFFIVRPDLRGSGIGNQLLQDVLLRAKDKNLGIDGVINMVPKYQRSGFISSHENARFRGVGGGSMPDGLEIIEALAMPDLEEYDANFFPSKRGKFLDVFLDQPGIVGLASMKGEDILGYGLMRKCRRGRKIGPLFANDGPTARMIAEGLLSMAPGEETFLDVPLINHQATDLADGLGMVPEFRTARLYTKYLPNIRWEGVFGITTLELG
jgi:GNAT superfamily N-acetyltransferase